MCLSALIPLGRFVLLAFNWKKEFVTEKFEILGSRSFFSMEEKSPCTGSEHKGKTTYTHMFGTIAQRTPWLGFFLVGLLICAVVMHRYEEILADNVELAFFVPLLIGHGGNTGGQTVSSVIRALAGVRGEYETGARIVSCEAFAGTLQSLILAIFVLPSLYYVLDISWAISVVVAVSLPLLGFFANTCGAALPFLAIRMGLDPAVVVGPLMTTLVDTVGLVIYLSVASYCVEFLGTPSAPPPPPLVPQVWWHLGGMHHNKHGARQNQVRQN